MLEGPAPKPFLKWAGGKRQIVARIVDAAPAEIETYYEPFIGGGAVFFALAAQRRFARAVIADVNRELILCYQAVKREVGAVIAALRRYPHSPAFYYRLRAVDPETMTLSERASRFIYLNRCGYNGLYRVNSRGQFNVPFGRYENPVICDEERLRAAAAALSKTRIVCEDFAKTLAPSKRRDFVYLDPPYVPLSRTSSFTAYAKDGFGPAEQVRLAGVLRRLGRRRVRALLSNSDCDVTRRLYDGLDTDSVPVRRAINSVASGRGSVAELLVKSYTF
jgi:DNA adenine methylase